MTVPPVPSGQGASVGGDADLQTAPSPPENLPPMSDSARTAFFHATDQYVIDLTDTSRMLMRRQAMDVVSESHVVTAASTLASRTSRRAAKTLGSVAGVLLGFGLGIVGSVVTADEIVWTTPAVVLFLAACTIGGVMMAVGALRE